MNTTLSQSVWQRGTLHYMAVDGYYPKHMEGWFLLSEDGRKIYARKIRGRNCWQFASVDRVIDFVPKETKS
jgi:hypothetical protein